MGLRVVCGSHVVEDVIVVVLGSRLSPMLKINMLLDKWEVGGCGGGLTGAGANAEPCLS